jgi:hypothetical protein
MYFRLNVNAVQEHLSILESDYRVSRGEETLFSSLDKVEIVIARSHHISVD